MQMPALVASHDRDRLLSAGWACRKPPSPSATAVDSHSSAVSDEQITERDSKTHGELPERCNGRTALSVLDLAHHARGHARLASELSRRQTARSPKLANPLTHGSKLWILNLQRHLR